MTRRTEHLCNYTFKNIPERTYSGRRTDQFCPLIGERTQSHTRGIAIMQTQNPHDTGKL